MPSEEERYRPLPDLMVPGHAELSTSREYTDEERARIEAVFAGTRFVDREHSGMTVTTTDVRWEQDVYDALRMRIGEEPYFANQRRVIVIGPEVRGNTLGLKRRADFDDEVGHESGWGA